jgi:hypothetical protein
LFTYKLLKKFPTNIIHNITKVYEANIKGKEPVLKNNVPNVQNNLKIVLHNFGYMSSEFHNEVSFLISEPNMGMAKVHIDKSRNFALNIPLKVNNEKSSYIAGKFLNIEDYTDAKKFIIDGKIGYTFDYNPDQYEEVKISNPILINTSLPHSWTNYDDDYRVLASLIFKTDNMKKALQICENWI